MNFQRWLALVCFISSVFVCDAFGQTIRWATASDILTLDPHAQNESLTNSFNAHVYERLTARDEQLNLMPGLATRWEQVDATTWRFYLRKGVRFHDGSAFDAHDVFFSIERAQDERSAVAQYAKALGKVRIIDDHAIELKQEKFNPVLLENLDAVFIMSRKWSAQHRVLRPQVFKANEETYATNHSNGTGPYIVTARVPDVRNVLRRFEGYWGKVSGNVNEVVHLPISLPATRTAALLKGEVDIVLDPPVQDQERLRTTTGTKLLVGPENRVVFLGFDQASKDLMYGDAAGGNPFKQAFVRRAVAHAIDIQALRTHIMRGMSVPAWCLVPSPLGCPDANLDARRPEFNLALAKQLLAQAGYANGFDVTLDCPNNRYVNDAALCTGIAAMLAKINIRVRVNAIPKAQFFAKLEKFETSFFLLGWGGAETDAQPTMEPLMHSLDAISGKGADNYGRFVNKPLDVLIDAAGQETEPAVRRGLIAKALALHADNVNHLVLHRQTLVWAMQNYVQTVPAANNHFRAWMTRVTEKEVSAL